MTLPAVDNGIAPTIKDAICTPHWVGNLNLKDSTLSLAGKFVDADHYDVLLAAYKALCLSATARDGAMETIMRVTDYMPEGHHKESIRNTINAVRT